MVVVGLQQVPVSLIHVSDIIGSLGGLGHDESLVVFGASHDQIDGRDSIGSGELVLDGFEVLVGHEAVSGEETNFFSSLVDLADDVEVLALLAEVSSGSSGVEGHGIGTRLEGGVHSLVSSKHDCGELVLSTLVEFTNIGGVSDGVGETEIKVSSVNNLSIGLSGNHTGAVSKCGCILEGVVQQQHFIWLDINNLSQRCDFPVVLEIVRCNKLFIFSEEISQETGRNCHIAAEHLLGLFLQDGSHL